MPSSSWQSSFLCGLCPLQKVVLLVVFCYAIGLYCPCPSVVTFHSFPRLSFLCSTTELTPIAKLPTYIVYVVTRDLILFWL